jgi:stress response protein YsnF
MATISRLYKDYESGARVVAELERAGIPDTEISIIANNDSGWFDRDRWRRIDRDADGTDDRAEGAAAGAGIGATLGGVVGLLTGLGMLAIPGIGPVVAAGWLASTAAVAAAGGAAGGLIGALTQSGVGEREAHAYAEGVRRGGTLVTVRVPDADRARVEAIMDRYDPMNTSSIGMEDRPGDWSGDRIVAAFENADRARAAREALAEAGLNNADIEVLENRDDLGTWTAMKRHAVPDEDAHLYAEGLGRGHSILVIRAVAGEHDRVMDVLSRFNPIDIDDHAAQWRKSGWSGVHPGKAAWDVGQQTSTASTTTATTPGTREEVIPVYEEQLKVGKRVVEQGHVRVRVYTVERPVQEGLTLREERVAVERRPVDRLASNMPGEAFQDRTVDVTTHREEPVISKEARVKEEIVVRQEADQRSETVRDAVRRTEVEVEDDRKKATTPASPSASPSRR